MTTLCKHMTTARCVLGFTLTIKEELQATGSSSVQKQGPEYWSLAPLLPANRLAYIASYGLKEFIIAIGVELLGRYTRTTCHYLGFNES